MIGFLRDRPSPDLEREAESLSARLALAGPEEESAILGRLGDALRILRRYDDAEAALARAIARSSDERGRLVHELRLAILDQYRGQNDRALANLLALERSADAGFRASHRDFVLQHLAKCLVEAGRREEAAPLLAQALALREARGDDRLVRSTRQAIAWLDWTGRFEADGFAVLEDVVPGEVLDRLGREIGAELDREGGRRHALRGLFDRSPAVRDLVRHGGVVGAVEAVLGEAAFAVRGLYFDKLPGANWPVAWHRDRTIAVAARSGAPGFGPWSTKDGVAHVEPPVAILEGMLAVRVHLDDCGPDDGPLRVVPGSHRTPGGDEVARPAMCLVRRGGLVLMRPLALHASSPAVAPTHRRVVHLEFAALELPPPLEWRDRFPIDERPSPRASGFGP